MIFTNLYHPCANCFKSEQISVLLCQLNKTTTVYMILSVSSQVSDLIISTVDTTRQSFFLKTFVDNEVPVLFVGPTGTGKSAITNNFLIKLPKEK